MPNKTTPDKIAKDLDQWAKGFLVGIVFGAVMVIGLIWAIGEKLH